MRVYLLYKIYTNQIYLVLAIASFKSASADDHGKTFQEIVTDYGFPLESYEVTTEDGYILTTFRIPHGRDGEASNDAAPVLIQHGYFDASDFAVVNGPEVSLAFYLATEGYDVWVSIQSAIIVIK